MKFISRVKSLFLASFASLILAAIFCAVLYSLPATHLIPCTDVWVQDLIMALIFAFFLQIILAPRILAGRYKIFLTMHVVVILLVLWLGVYGISPLGYTGGYTDTLRGFVVVTRQKGITSVPLNSVITLGYNAANIYPVTFPSDVTCAWMSTNGGLLEDPRSCYTAYIPPKANYDVVRVDIQPGCGLPASTGQFKISILP